MHKTFSTQKQQYLSQSLSKKRRKKKRKKKRCKAHLSKYPFIVFFHITLQCKDQAHHSITIQRGVILILLDKQLSYVSSFECMVASMNISFQSIVCSVSHYSLSRAEGQGQAGQGFARRLLTQLVSPAGDLKRISILKF